MASFKNFQNANKKHDQKLSRNLNNPDFNPTVSAIGEDMADSFSRNFRKWKKLLVFLRGYPDIFYELITPEVEDNGKKKKTFIWGLDQRIRLRAMVRYTSIYGVLPRGTGKTFEGMAVLIFVCIFFPKSKISLTAQTRENSAKLIKEKYEELIRTFPLLKEEVYSAKFQKDTAEIEFHSESTLTNLANHQSSKGARRHRGIVDEDNLTDGDIYQDVLEPIFNVPRRTERGNVNPLELNGSISQLTSAGHKGSPCYYRCLKKLEGYEQNSGEFVFGSSWKLASFYGRGESVDAVLTKKRNLSTIAFEMNYMGHFVGAADNALVSSSKLLDCRTLKKAELQGKENGEYVFGIDVARSDDAKNCQTEIAIGKIIRYANKKIKSINIVNIVSVSGTLDSEAQSIVVKKLDKLFNPEIIVVDDNGLSKLLCDSLIKEQFDTDGTSLGCFDTLNSERTPDIHNAPKKVYCYLAQSNDYEAIPYLMELVETNKIQLLERKESNEMDVMDSKNNAENYLPFLQTDFLIEEIINLKIKTLSNGKLGIEQVVKKLPKDRFSAVLYMCWYIVKYMDRMVEQDDRSDLDYLAQYISW